MPLKEGMVGKCTAAEGGYFENEWDYQIVLHYSFISKF